MSDFDNIVDDFIDFVGTMPADQKIDHAMRDGDINPWCYCAVGEFFRKRDDKRVEAPGDARTLDFQEAMYEAGLACTFEALNSNQPATYGELAKLIEENLENPDLDWEHGSLGSG